MAAEQGIVNIHAQTILPATPHLTALNLRKDPIPIIAPVIVCVVLTGMPNAEEINNVVAAPSSAQNPSTGLSLATFWPMVLTIRQPPNIVPNAIAV
jgi:hypothetical protein